MLKVNCTDNNGKTPLDLAAEQGHKEIVEILDNERYALINRRYRMHLHRHLAAEQEYSRDRKNSL